MLLAVSLLASSLPATRAVEVFRCVAVDGSTIYQDRPCASGQAQQTVQLPDDPMLPPPSPEPAPAPTPTPPVEPAPEPPLAVAGPEFVLCTRADGSRYISEDGSIGRTAVPFGMVADSGQSLAEAYGGRNGIGVSAPGLRDIPNLPAGEMPLAGAYVWVDDECHRTRPGEACAWLGSRLDGVGKKLKRAFSDTAPQLKQEQAALRERMRGCP